MNDDSIDDLTDIHIENAIHELQWILTGGNESPIFDGEKETLDRMM